MTEAEKINYLFKHPEGLTPNDDKEYVGLEIEFASPYSRLALVTSMIKHGLFGVASLGTDGSISGNDCTCYRMNCHCEIDFNIRGANTPKDAKSMKKLPYYVGYEMRILATENDISNIIDSAIECIKDMGGVVNNTCGLHVHVDARSLKAPDFKSKCTDWFNVQAALLACVKKHRSRNRFCLPADNTGEVCTDILANKNGHHVGVHYVPRLKTFEVRFHHGSLNKTRIKNWVSLLLKIKYGKIANKLKDKYDLKKCLDLNNNLIKYIDSRIVG